MRRKLVITSEPGIRKEEPRKDSLILFFLATLPLTIFLAFHLAYYQRIYPKIAVAGINLSNTTKDKAFKILSEQINLKRPKQIVLMGPTRVWKENLAEFDFQYETSESVETAYKIGRQKDFLTGLQEKKQAWSKGVNLPLSFQINQPRLKEKIGEISRVLFIPPVAPQLKISEGSSGGKDNRVSIENGQIGQEVDQEKLLTVITSQLAYLENKPLLIPLKKINPQLSNEQILLAEERAQKFLGKMLKLRFEDQTFALTEKELLGFLSLTGGFQAEKISSYLDNLTLSLNRLPQNAAFQFLPPRSPGETGRVTIFRPAKEGIRLKSDDLHQQILASLSKFENEDEKELVLLISYETLKAQVETEDINNLGIKDLLGRGISYFRGSAPSRVHNIILATSRLNGLLVAPGETFSFNEALGEVSKETGYEEAYVIKEGRTLLGDGGGVCQVSTTLFRAALATGLPIEERHPHAYRVSYYEQGPLSRQNQTLTGVGQNTIIGMDATVFSPGVNLKFKNDTPAYLLIQTILETKTGTLMFELYGTSDGRVVTIGQPRVWDRTSPPPDLYQDDPTLAAGVVKQVEKAIWGSKAAFDWKVVRNGDVLQDRTFYSAYRAWRAVYLRGTK